MTRRDGLPGFSARSALRGDAGHRKPCATLSESPGKPPFRSPIRPVGGRRKALMMHRITCGFSLPDRPNGRSLWVIFIGPWYRGQKALK